MVASVSNFVAGDLDVLCSVNGLLTLLCPLPLISLHLIHQTLLYVLFILGGGVTLGYLADVIMKLLLDGSS